jgi:hypothetical protein
MANFLSDLFSSGATSLVTAVGDALDKVTTSDEEKKELDNELAKASMQYELQMATLGVQEKQIEMQDRDSARVNQSRVQESEHASWLAKNVQPFLAIVIIALTFGMYWYIVFNGDKKNLDDSGMKDLVIYILGALTTIVTQVVAYFFGSSSGSAAKSKTLDQMMSKRP